MGPLATVSSALVVALTLSQPAFARAVTPQALTPRALTPRALTPRALTPRSVADSQKVIDALKKQITKDPQGVTGSWGDICANNGTFECATNPSGEKALAGIDINGDELEGDLTLDFLTELTNLTYFHANSNGFKGTLPNLSGLPYFKEIDVSGNQLSGSFPEGALSATLLTFLDLRFNSFEGSVPSGVFAMGLDVLFLNNNQFSGSIPSNLWNTSALYVTLSNNSFSGSIPSIDAGSVGINEIQLGNNQFEGSLPEDWSAAQALTLFAAENNQLSGTVPESLCKIKTLEILTLNGNAFTEDLGPSCEALKQKGILTI